MTIEDALNALSARQQRHVRAVWAAYEASEISAEEFIQIVTAIVLRGNARGYLLGASHVLAAVEKSVGVVELAQAAPAGRHLDESRIATAITTILQQDDLDPVMQLTRLADNEPKEAASEGSHEALKGSTHVTGWRRTLDSSACQLCRWWAREGRVWQPDHPMPRHPGCTCTQSPVVTVTDNYQTDRQAADRRQERRRA